jgi:hypothetical protein
MKTRRQFIQTSSSALAAAAISPISSMAQSKISANDKIGVALMGCKGMGNYNLEDHLRIPEIECIAMCDIDENILNERAESITKKTGKKPKLVKDYR